MERSQIRRNLIARQQGDHQHAFAQVLLGWRGQMACEFEREQGRLVHGGIAIVPDSAPHFFNGLSEDSELLVIDLAPADPYLQALEQACEQPLLSTLFSQPHFLTLTPDSQPLLDFAAHQLRRAGAQISPQLHCQLISLFLTQFGQMHAPSVARVLNHSRLEEQALNMLIDQRLSSPLSNAAMASAMHLSESHFYCLCQRQFGITPQQYVMQRRMRRARQLLLETRMPLTELAAEVGFAQLSGFSRAYKRFYHQTPSATRRRTD
ncbi:helix-turn-helix transcriptional regulator [Photobacterium atrarenae]|uniref:AraC family transcriptional regulator n=1 Tax=Photobacterium atrarenae TaxID=865757 RepID=A0ABY5GGB4_9GAMM|nr:AraC family transcriptional regulator [Photobacterium atrarenae]UTV27866.1 AraC family transcriptional regulator [Photobacterium atrarenae]